MVSEKQIAANRRNAKKSTGPRTAEGKTRSSKNRLAHGLRSRDTVLPGENEGEYEKFLEVLREDLAPDGALEEILVRRVSESLWRLRRLGKIESQLYSLEMAENRFYAQNSFSEAVQASAFPVGAAFRKLNLSNIPENLSRYEASIERAAFRSLDRLRELQRLRDLRGERKVKALSVSGEAEGK